MYKRKFTKSFYLSIVAGTIIILIAVTLLFYFRSNTPVNLADISTGSKNINQQVKKAVDNVFIEWKDYKSDKFTIKYPSNWQIDNLQYFFAYDPKEVFVTHSRPPIIYYHFVTIRQSEITKKSAKQYVDEEFEKKADEKKKYQQLIEQNQKNTNSNYSKSDPDVFPQYNNRVSMTKANLEFEAYNLFPLSAGLYKQNKAFAVSNGKVLIVGEAVFDNFEDGSIESQILKSIAFNN